MFTPDEEVVTKIQQAWGLQILLGLDRNKAVQAAQAVIPWALENYANLYEAQTQDPGSANYRPPRSGGRWRQMQAVLALRSA
jgi:hypothetical protein